MQPSPQTAPQSAFEYGKDGARTIVVGFDGSETATNAAAYAAGLARRSDARLIVVLVTGVGGLAALAPGGVVALAQRAEEVTASVTATVADNARRLGIAADVVHRSGEAAHEIAAVADAEHADLVVVGASTKTGHRLVGSTATRLVRAGRWPVTVVP